MDMNLSPKRVDRLTRQGFEAVHWVGAPTAPDDEILESAREHRSCFQRSAKKVARSGRSLAGSCDGCGGPQPSIPTALYIVAA